jgi:hypothetical protein
VGDTNHISSSITDLGHTRRRTFSQLAQHRVPQYTLWRVGMLLTATLFFSFFFFFFVGNFLIFLFQVFDVGDEMTFEHLSLWKEEFLFVHGEVPFIVIGNKVDLDSRRKVHFHLFFFFFFWLEVDVF